MHETLKNRTYLGKKKLIFWVPIFSRPKVVIDVETTCITASYVKDIDWKFHKLFIFIFDKPIVDLWMFLLTKWLFIVRNGTSFHLQWSVTAVLLWKKIQFLKIDIFGSSLLKPWAGLYLYSKAFFGTPNCRKK